MTNVKDGDRFDFIVVGGGLAGNTVAGRLAENSDVRVLVIEAGTGTPEEVPDITTPVLAQELRGTEHDWHYRTTFVDRPDYQRVENVNTRGRALGGSSSLNYFTWIPGEKATFDRWAEFGGEEWSWEPLVPYLRKSVTYHDDEKLFPEELHEIGSGGPIPIAHAELAPNLQPFRDALTKAWQEVGEEIRENIFDGTLRGLTHSVNTVYKGKRSGSYLFLKGKDNITVQADSYSKKLIIDEADKTVKGVVFIDTKTSEEITVYAEREVIVSQGVFETPKLLLLSGIGPVDELNKHNIPVKLESPHVGQHLIDHPGVPFVLRLKDGYAQDSIVLRPGPKYDAAVAQYKKDNTGPLASPLFLELVGFPRIDSYLEKDPVYRKAKEANGGKDPFSPEGQPHFELDFVSVFGSAFQWHYPTPKEGDHLTVMVDLVRPVYEGGQVTLNSTDPLEQPHINLNYFSNELDIIALREGIRFTYHLLTQTEAFKDLVVSEYPFPIELDDDDALRETVLERAQTSYHPVGTARLSKSIEQGVVDPALRVHGIKNLRVIDASVVPVIPDSRIQNSVYAIAEKGADAIKADHSDLYGSQ